MNIGNGFVANIYDISVISQIQTFMDNKTFPTIIYYALCRLGSRYGLTMGEEVAEVVPCKTSNRFLWFFESIFLHVFLIKLTPQKYQSIVNYLVILFAPRIIRMVPVGPNRIAFPSYLTALVLLGLFAKTWKETTKKNDLQPDISTSIEEESFEGKCSICMYTMNVPSATVCGHIFCWSCILPWILDAKSCPTCRTECRPQDILPLVHYCPTGSDWKPFYLDSR